MGAEMTSYRIKHIQTGYYYQPNKHWGCGLSVKGKVYQTKHNVLSYDIGKIVIQARENNRIYQATKDSLAWKMTGYNKFELVTSADDWVIEPLSTSSVKP